MAIVPSLFSPGSVWGSGNDPFMTLHREMNRLFDDVIRGPVGPARAQGGGQSPMLMSPNVDVTETEKEVRVRAELPGVAEKDIELSLDDNVLTLRAEKRQERTEEREGVHFSERSFGTFQRSFRIPFRINPDQVQAKFENGVLTVTLPKGQQSQSHRIQVQGAQPGAGSPQISGQSSGSGSANPPGGSEPSTQGNGTGPAEGTGSSAARGA